MIYESKCVVPVLFYDSLGCLQVLWSMHILSSATCISTVYSRVLCSIDNSIDVKTVLSLLLPAFGLFGCVFDIVNEMSSVNFILM